MPWKKNGRDTNKKKRKRSHGIKNVYDYLQSFAIALQLIASWSSWCIFFYDFSTLLYDCFWAWLGGEPSDLTHIGFCDSHCWMSQNGRKVLFNSFINNQSQNLHCNSDFDSRLVGEAISHQTKPIFLVILRCSTKNQFLSSFSVAPTWKWRERERERERERKRERKPVRCWQFSSTSNRSCTPDRLHHEEYGYIWYEVYELSDADHPS